VCGAELNFDHLHLPEPKEYPLNPFEPSSWMLSS